MKSKILPKQTAIFLPFFMGAILFTTIILRAQVAPQQPQTQSSNSFPAAKFSDTKLTYKIIDASNKTFGYDIYANERMIIHQASMPALPGNEGFKTKNTAEKVAQFVIAQIKKGEMPPTVTVEEMKKLNALK
jgi:hypothetical protein